MKPADVQPEWVEGEEVLNTGEKRQNESSSDAEKPQGAGPSLYVPLFGGGRKRRVLQGAYVSDRDLR